MLDRREIQTNALAGDADLTERNSDKPVLDWEARNVRKHRGG